MSSSSSGRRLVTLFCELCARFGLTDVEAAALTGCAPAVVRRIRRDGQLPERAPSRRRLTEFIERADRASDRRALGLP
jgi:hypothetical protein